MTAISDLLSNGSSLTVTDLVANSIIDSSVATPTPSRKIQAERLLRTIGVGDAAIEAPEHAFVMRGVRGHCLPSFGASRSISQGATTIATKNENSIAAEALAGIGAI